MSLFIIFTFGFFILGAFDYSYNFWIYPIWIASLFGFPIAHYRTKGKKVLLWIIVMCVVIAIALGVVGTKTIHDIYARIGGLPGHYERYSNFIWHGPETFIPAEGYTH